MDKIVTIARREFTAMVATKTFLFTLVLMPVLMFGGIVLIPSLQKLSGMKNRRIIVADATGKYFDSLHKAATERNDAFQETLESEQIQNSGDPSFGVDILEFEALPADMLTDETRLALSNEIRDGNLYALVELPAGFDDVQPDSKARFVSHDAVMSDARRWLENHLRESIRNERLIERGIDPEMVAEAFANVQLEPTTPYDQTDDGRLTSQEGASRMATMFLPFGVMMLMFMVIFMAAQPMLESGMEEKQHRIAELLLGSVSPKELMTGKLLGNVAGSFVIFAIYGAGAIIIANRNGWQINLDWSQMPWLIAFQVLGVLFFSSIFLAIGASVAELKEAQSLLMPVWLMLASPLMVWFLAVRDPNGIVAVALSFFPPSAPLMMSLRLSGGQSIPIWHAPLSAMLMIAATAGVIAIASRVYRASLLKTDSAASFRKIVQRWRAAE